MTPKAWMPAAILSGLSLVSVLVGARAAPIEPVPTVTNAQQKLGRVAVEDVSGRTIGHVDHVQPATGAPLNVQVALDLPSGGTKLVTIAATDLRFDSSKDIVVTDLPKSEITAMTGHP